MKRFFSLLFVLLISLPVLLWVADRVRGNDDNTVHQGFPIPQAEVLFERGYYRAVDGWFRESLPAAAPLRVLHHWMQYRLFGVSATPAVQVGVDGWLYAGRTDEGSDDDAAVRQTGEHLLLTLHAVERLLAAEHRRFIFTVVPDKAAIYPEFTGNGPALDTPPLYRALREAHARHPLAAFVPLDAALKQAKLGGDDVYRPRSRLWTCSGAAAAATQILTAARMTLPASKRPPPAACPSPDDDLYRLLLGIAPPSPFPAAGHPSGPHAVNGPAAVCYGDGYLDRLLPHLRRTFSALSVVDTTRAATIGPGLLERPADVVLLESGADRLARLHINLEALYRPASTPIRGVVSDPVDLRQAVPLDQCALEVDADGLEIRSSGERGRFALPPLSGSTDAAFAMLRLTFAADQTNRATVDVAPGRCAPFVRQMDREIHFMLVPLPFMPTVRPQINPSPHPGVFTLERAEVLRFYGSQKPPTASTDAGGVPEAVAMLPDLAAAVPSPPPELSHLPAPSTVPPAPPPFSLSLTDFAAGRIFQRRGTAADIVVTGSYTGSAAPIEARVVAADTDVPVVPWTTVDDSPQNGVFTGILHHVPQGGWYRLEVRSSMKPAAVSAGTHRWGVGMLVACIGQSNMREWFTTGSAHRPAARLALYGGGRWARSPALGNGALALGNRLVAAFDIPVGLLDYAVNGSGLTAKAEWGSGFWLDNGPRSICRQFVDGVHAAGGAVEYIVWMQGEADAARGTVSRTEYRSALEELVQRLRVEIRNGSSRPALPFLIIPLVKRPTGRDRPCQWIRGAQMDVLRRLPECYLAALSMDLKNRGRQHLATAAYTTLGLRTARTIEYVAGRAAFHRGPHIVAVARTAERTIDVGLRHRGGTDFTPAAGISGFSVVSGEETLPIVSVSRHDANTIRIVTAVDLPERFRLRYLYGAHPDTTRAVHDNSALRLPLEPYDGG